VARIGTFGAIEQRQFDVLNRGSPCQQIELLKDEADLAIANVGKLVAIEFTYVLAVQ